MNRCLTRIALAASLSVALAGAFASAAGADTAVMGSTLTNNYDGGVSTSALSVQFSFDPVTSTNPVVSPGNGTITDWKVKSADDGAIYTLKVMRPNGPVSLVAATTTNFTAVRSVQAPTAVPIGTGVSTPTGAIFDYPASLPISKGDYIGVVTGGTATGLPQAMANGLTQSVFANNFASQPANGSSADLTADAQHELLLQASVQLTPTAPATTAPATTAPATTAPATTAKKKCKKKKKHRAAESAKKKHKKRCKKHKKRR